jgi:hypothetical protein
MPRQRLITIAALLALLVCCTFAPVASASSTLLSGYGAPGEGNQAILGATVIGGSGGGRGGSTGSGSSAPQTVSIEAVTPPSTTPRAGSRGTGSGGGSAHIQARHRAGAASKSAGATAPAKPVDVQAVSAPALGLSGTDVAYVVLGFLVLMLTAVVTVLLTRGDRSAQGGRGETESG